jgi:hypothetical protein
MTTRHAPRWDLTANDPNTDAEVGGWVGTIEVTEGATRRRAAFYGRTKADVKASIKQAQARVDVGAPAKDAKALLSAVLTAWIASTLEASDLKPSTKATYTTLLRSQVLTDDIASKPLADLKPGHVEQLTVRMRDKGCSPSTIRQTYTVLRSVLETAVRDELLASNPATKVKRPGVPRTEAHYLSIAEVAKKSRYAPLLRLLVATGLRRGEALACAGRTSTSPTAFCGSLARSHGPTGTWSSSEAQDGALTPRRAPLPHDCGAVAVGQGQQSGRAAQGGLDLG